ncbi:hypothetical protein [Streptomyces olivaceiscleroticus]|uniref:Uncharacterized protein n=1 Tax=Streptomyces olivaceiscleroticus TaxID=68245 RepID=A0ABN1ADL0_9ACTN
MGRIDPKYLPLIADDWRYARLIKLSKRLLEERVAQPCGNCEQGRIMVRDENGDEYTVSSEACNGTSTAPTLADNEDNGQAGTGGR